MTKQSRLHAAIIEPDSAARDRLRQACAASGCFEAIIMTAGSDDVIERVRSGENFDLFFISGRLPQEETRYLLSHVQRQPSSRDAACVVVGERVCSDVKIVSDLFAGFDGILFEPFSVDGLAEVTEIVARVKKDRAQRRERTAIDLLVRELADLIGELCSCEQAGYRAPIIRRVLTEIRDVLADLSDDASAYYYEVLIKHFGSLPVPRRKVYNGVSTRIRQKVQQQIETKSLKQLGLVQELKKIAAG